MSPARKSGPEDPVEARLDEIARLLALLASRGQSLQDAVADLSAVGFGPTRIAQLLGTSPGYARVAADRARKKAGPKQKGPEG
jgi:DNA-directed RNA polymerase specialized sigma24 family protein